MADADYDINHYTLKEIECMFNVSAKSTADEIELTEFQLREKILNCGHVDKKLTAEVINFLSDAKKWLLQQCDSKRPPNSLLTNKIYRNIPTYDKTSREDELVTKPTTPFVYTQSSDYFQGVLNPFEKRIVTKNICVDTIFRINYSSTKSTNFMYILPVSIANITSLKITSFELPRNLNAISAQYQNNTMKIYLYNLAGIADGAFAIVIPDGTYSADEFKTVLNNYFVYLGNGLENIHVNIDTATHATTFYATVDATQSPDFYYEIDFANDLNIDFHKTLGWMLGFKSAEYVVTAANTKLALDGSSGAVTYMYYLASESYFMCAINEYFFIELDDFHNSCSCDTIVSTNNYTGTYLGNNIIAKILTCPTDTQTHIFSFREYFGPVNLEKLKIRAITRFGDVLDLANIDYSFTLEAKQLYST